MQTKFFKLYIISLSSLAFVLVNFPLYITCALHFRDPVTLWRLIAHNPNQYLFNCFFFPVAAFFICWGGIRLNSLVDALHKRDPEAITRYRKSFYMLGLVLVYAVAAFVIFYSSDPSKEIDLTGLSPAYARRGAAANHFVLQSLKPSPPGLRNRDDLEKLDEWRDLEPIWPKLYEKPMRELIPIANLKTYEGLPKRGVQALKDLLETDVTGLSSSLHKAIPYLQLVFERRYLDRVKKAFPKLPIYNRRDTLANTIELAANTVIVGHFFMLLLALMLLRRKIFEGSPIPPELMDIAKKLFVAVAMYAFWVGLRLLVLQDISLVFGGPYGTVGDVFAGTMLVLTSGIYLTAVMTTSDKLLNRLANLWPLILGFGTALGSFIDPLRASRLFGSLADPRQLGIVVFASLLIISLCIIWVMTRPAPSRKKEVSGLHS